MQQHPVDVQPPENGNQSAILAVVLVAVGIWWVWLGVRKGAEAPALQVMVGVGLVLAGVLLSRKTVTDPVAALSHWQRVALGAAIAGAILAYSLFLLR
jgi:hypothetical protein